MYIGPPVVGSIPPCLETVQQLPRPCEGSAQIQVFLTGPPPAECLVEVKACDIAEVGHAGYGLQEPEPLYGPAVKNNVYEVEKNVVQNLGSMYASRSERERDQYAARVTATSDKEASARPAFKAEPLVRPSGLLTIQSRDWIAHA